MRNILVLGESDHDLQLWLRNCTPGMVVRQSSRKAYMGDIVFICATDQDLHDGILAGYIFSSVVRVEIGASATRVKPYLRGF